MTEPPNVDKVMGRLGVLWRVWVPRLPFGRVWSRLTTLWTKRVSEPLPDPHAPLPWTIDVDGSWDVELPGASFSIENIRIRVKTAASPGAIKKGK